MAAAVSPAQTGTLLVRHAPSLNGTINGAVRQMSGESVTLNSGTTITGHLLVPGVPMLKLNGSPVTFGGTVVGTGAATPSGYTVTLNSNTTLGELDTRIDPEVLPTVAAPPAPAGTTDATVSSLSQAVNFATLRNLTINSNVGQVAVPAGTYGKFTVNSGSGLTLGVQGATERAVYNLQGLNLNSSTQVNVVGPVTINLPGNLVIAGSIGSPTSLAWLLINVANNDIPLNTNSAVYGYVTAPNSTLLLNTGAQVVGGAVVDRLTMNGGSRLQLIDIPPSVVLTAPTANTVATAPAAVALTANASDLDGTVAKVEFFAGATKIGERTAAPYQVSWIAPAGTYTLTAKATDNAGVTALSTAITFVANAPPSVALTAPAANSVFAVPASLMLAASASDSDGSIAKVEFFDGTTKLGEVTTSPYQLALAGLVAHTYNFAVRTTDNYGATTTSPAQSVIVEKPPTATVVAPVSVPRGTGVALTATAIDADGSVAKVEFYRGTTLLGTVSTPSGSPPVYRFTDNGASAPGAYSYTVRSYDNLGLYTDSTASTVAVLATLPYTADFEEAEGYSLAPLDGQLGWTASPPTAASVTADAAYTALHSVALAPGTPPVRIAQAFAPLAGKDVVFMDFFARPVAEPDPSASTTFDVEGARFAFALNGATATLNAFNGDGTGGGVWQTTTFTVPVGADRQVQAWTRLTARLDFTHKTWDLYAGGVMVAANLNLRDNTATYLSSFAVRGDAATTSRIDYLFAGADNPLFADSNSNGLDDAWETAHGLSLTAINRDDDPDSDGVSTLNEYVAGTDPSDFYNGQAPVLVSLVASDGRPGTDGMVAVRVTRADGTLLANAPLSFQFTTGSAQVATTSTGAFSNAVSVRTDAQGVARVYVVFNSALTAILTTTARSGTTAASLSISLSAPIIDSDHNGLPDDWELRYFGHTGADPNADDDGDGISNIDEFRNGTDPTDYYNGVLPTITSLVSADGSLASDGSLSVKITNSTGAPLVNAPATFRAVIGGHLLSASPSGPGQTEVQVRSDAQGIAKAFVKAGPSTP
jgi:hypothetical protein